MSALHPLMAEILAAHGMPQRPPQQQPTQYRAAVGRRRAFLSLADVRAYERGFALYPLLPSGVVWGTPAWAGHFDAECEFEEQEDARRDAAEQETAE